MTHTKPSKSARKRKHLALQALGEKLIGLKATELDSMPLAQDLHMAVRGAANMSSHGALRRQKQLIGKLMRDADVDEIRTALHRLGANERRARRLFATAERWRDRLATDGAAALDAFNAEVSNDDSGISQMLSELSRGVDERTEKTLRRQIFRRVHAILAKIGS